MAVNIMVDNAHYEQACAMLGLKPLHVRRQEFVNGLLSILRPAKVDIMTSSSWKRMEHIILEVMIVNSENIFATKLDSSRVLYLSSQEHKNTE